MWFFAKRDGEWFVDSYASTPLGGTLPVPGAGQSDRRSGSRGSPELRDAPEQEPPLELVLRERRSLRPGQRTHEFESPRRAARRIRTFVMLLITRTPRNGAMNARYDEAIWKRRAKSPLVPVTESR
jgi:hypothetical protein